MEFLLLAAIFLTSSGFLISAAVAPSTPAVIAPTPASGSDEGGAAAPQLRPETPEMNTPLRQEVSGPASGNAASN
jgi:hypothetical protein